MNKPYLKFGISVLTLICIALGLYFMMNKSSVNENQTSPNNYEQATGTENIIEEKQSENNNVNDETKPKNPTLDLTKLQGKDRLYTEEEGKYENLSKEEQQVFIEAYHCRNYQGKGKQACKQYAEIKEAEVKGVRLVALKDGVIVIYLNGDGFVKGRLYIYDLKKRELVREVIDTGNIAFGPNSIIWVDLPVGGQILKLYKPGMLNFIDIIDSEVKTDYKTRIEISYIKHEGVYFYGRNFPIDFKNDTIIVYVHLYNFTPIESSFNEFGSYTPMHTEYELISKTPKTFDLSNLP